MERKILKTVCFNLKRTTSPGRTSDDIHEWSAWAQKMKTCINDAISIIDNLIEQDLNDKENKNDDKPTTFTLQ